MGRSRVVDQDDECIRIASFSVAFGTAINSHCTSTLSVSTSVLQQNWKRLKSKLVYDLPQESAVEEYFYYGY